MKSSNREKSLLKNTTIISIGMVCTKMITFLLLPLYTAILTTKEYGIVDFLSTLVSLSLPLVTFQIEQALFRELIEVRNDEEKIRGIISSGVLTVILQCLIFLLIFLIVSPFINSGYKYFLTTNVIAYIFSSLFLQISRGLGNNKKYAVGSFLSALSTIIFNVLFLVVIRLGANGMLLGTMLGQICGALYLFFSLKLYNYISIKDYKKSTTKKLWKYSVPLIPNAISWWIFNASDRFIATAILGVEQNGILAASLKFATVYITLYNIFNMSWTESISMAIKDDDLDDYFNKMFNIVMNLFIALAIGIIAFMPFVFPIMINKNFQSGYGLVPISIIASLFNVIVGLISVIYVGKKNTKAIANTSIVSAIINIIVHLSLIRYIGLYAAVISTLLSFFTMSIYRIYDINKKYFKIKLNKKVILLTILTLFIVLYAYYKNNLILNIFSILITIVFAWLINKKSVSTIMNLLKKKIKNKRGVL